MAECKIYRPLAPFLSSHNLLTDKPRELTKPSKEAENLLASM